MVKNAATEIIHIKTTYNYKLQLSPIALSSNICYYLKNSNKPYLMAMWKCMENGERQVELKPYWQMFSLKS